MPNTQGKGFLYLFVSVSSFALSVHISKKALGLCPAITVTEFNCYLAAIGFLLVGWFCRTLRWRVGDLDSVRPMALWRCLRDQPLWLTLPPLLGAVGGWLMNITIQDYGADMAAFLANQMLVFLVLGGLLMGERVGWLEGTAICVVVAGAFLFSYRGGEFQWMALVLMAGASLFSAVKQLLIKQASVATPLPVVMATALVMMGLPMTVLGLVTGVWRWPGQVEMGWLALGAVTGSMIAMGLLYSAYAMVGVARGAPLNAMRPLMVLAIGLVLGQPFPAGMQAAGGVLILGGSVALCVLHQPAGSGE